MHSFVRNLITEWRRIGLPFSGETVIVAVSGGADSVSLLLALHNLFTLKKLGHRIVAAHFNHNLRGAESDADEEYVRDLTIKLGVELAVGHGDVSRSGNLEQNARIARYDFLTRTAENVGAFAVVAGHTVNDQAETFLLNLIRGSGQGGLSGMKAVRLLESEKVRGGESEKKNGEESDKSHLLTFSMSHPLLVRPLLTWAKRIDTEGFCRDCGVEYRYDTMNEDTAFKRVRIRKVLIPLLEDLNPRIIETLARTAGIIANQPAPVDDPEYRDDSLFIKNLKLLGEMERQNRIRTWLVARRGSARGLDMKHITAVSRLTLSSKSGRVAELPGGARVIKSGGKLIYKENKVENYLSDN